MSTRRTPAVLASVLLLVGGCGQPAPPPLYPVSGTLASADGKPITSGGLIFMPDSGGWGGRVINGSLNPDGAFTTTTSTSDGGKTELKPGIPAGRYKVVYHPPSDGQKLGLETELPDVVVIEPKENVLTLKLPEKTAEPKSGPPADKPGGGS
jgi:hypothetical protein